MLKRITFLVLFSFLLIGCGANDNKDGLTGQNPIIEDEPGMIGYVIERYEKRVLVVESEPLDFSDTGGVSEFYNAIVFSNVPDEIDVGDKVKVWFDIVAESYPGQSSAQKIEVIAPKQPDGANLTEPEAIREALQQLQSPEFGIRSIKNVQFADGIWTVTIRQNEEDFMIEISDAPTTNEEELPSTSGKLPEIPIAELTSELRSRLYQQHDETTYEVINFSSKEELIEFLAEVAHIDYATELFHTYYEEKDGKIYIIPRGGLPFLLPDEPYEINHVSKNEAIVEQVTEDELFGKYKITVTFIFDGNSWKYKDYLFEQ